MITQQRSLLLIPNTSAGNHGLRSVEIIIYQMFPGFQFVKILARKTSSTLIRRPHEAIITHYFIKHDEPNTQHVLLKRKKRT